jgi:hypothetical protein
MKHPTTTPLMNYVEMVHEYGRNSEIVTAYYEARAAKNATFKKQADALHRLLDKLAADMERERVWAEDRAARQAKQPESIMASVVWPFFIGTGLAYLVLTFLPCIVLIFLRSIGLL